VTDPFTPDRPESLARPEIEARQLKLLKQLLHELPGRNPFWTRKWAQAGVDPRDVSQLGDLQELPYCLKQELVDDQQAHPPYGTNLTYPLTAYSRLHQTSGTTGRPLRWLDTPESWDWFMRCWAQKYRIMGLRRDDVMAFPFSFGPFIGFWAAFDSSTRMGNLSLAMGGMSTEARLQMIAELRATVVCCTPSYALRMAEVAESTGLRLSETAVRALIVAGEPGGNIPAFRQRIEAAWGARVIDHWGMTDIGSLAMEPAEAPGGLLVLETECIAEIVDPETGAPSPAGIPGELVITNLGRLGQPVVRYRTGDLVRAATSPCPSGFQLLRLEGGIIGRVDDMVTIRGNNVFPSSVEAILREFAEIAEYRLVVSTVRSMSQLQIDIEPQPLASETLAARVARAIRDRLNFHADVVVVPSGSLPRFELKGRRFVRAES
jgi:phenylacetate-CoA ligase